MEEKKNKMDTGLVTRTYKTEIAIHRDSETAKPIMVGQASITDEPYDMGWYVEEVVSGAFDNVLNDDVRVLKNHDRNLILGRTKSGTAEIYINTAGNLEYKSEIPTKRSYGKDLIDELEKGDIDESSFAFYVEDSEWIERDSEEKPLWRILKVKLLLDVGPVTYGANPSTTVAKRSYDHYLETREVPKKDDARKMHKRAEMFMAKAAD